MLPLGTKAPYFNLLDTVSGKNLSLEDCKGLNGTVIMFICNHCPFVKHVNNQLVSVSNDFRARGISFIAISSNDVKYYPEDAPDKMSDTAKNEGYKFPYLYDASQKVARAYQAACTPDFFIFDNSLNLVYRGQLDNSRPNNGVTSDGKDVRNTLNALLMKQFINPNQKPSLGCNIKWKRDNE